MKKQSDARKDGEVEENPAILPFLSRLRKLHLKEDYVKTNLGKGMFSLKKRRKPVDSHPEASAEQRPESPLDLTGLQPIDPEDLSDHLFAEVFPDVERPVADPADVVPSEPTCPFEFEDPDAPAVVASHSGAGGGLLPVDFKKSKKSWTTKSFKKRNENYLKINLKKKCFASRGYKKLNVAREKRRAHYRAKARQHSNQ